VCGARGSIPCAGREFTGIGGDTSCVAVATDGGAPALVLDAGSGVRNVSALLGGRPFDGTILLSHLHWDHTQGLPFFGGGTRADAVVRVRLPEQGVAAEELMARCMSPPHFPIRPGELEGAWSFGAYEEGVMEVEGLRVLAREVPHKGGRTMGLRVSDGRRSLAYVPDHAPHALGPGPDGLGPLHPAALELAEGVDLLIHGAHFTAEELPAVAGFGHAAAEYAVTLASAAGAKRLLLFHHSPSRTDDQVSALAARLRRGAGVSVEPAATGQVVHL